MAYPKTPNTTDKTGKPKLPPNDNDGSQNPIPKPDWLYRTDNKQQEPSPMNVANQSTVSNRNRDASSASNDPSTTVGNSHHDHLLETVVQLGKDSYIIKAYAPCGKQKLFAIECERPMSGYDGICPECGGQHVKLAKSRGYYVSIDSIYEALGQKQMEKEHKQGPKKIERLNKVKENLPPLDHPILGKNKGIEGDSNSDNMDATIFCMFAYSNVFDSLLHMDVHNQESIEKLQKLLRENIVNVLRSELGFVQRDTMFHFRAQLRETTGDASFKNMGKDPSEFLRALEQLFQYAPLKTIPPDQPPNDNGSNITTNIIWEIFDANPHNLPLTNIASIFRNSLSEIPAKLATIPPFLVLIAPRDERSLRSYRYIIPDRQITLDNKILQLVCARCKQTNHDSNQSHDFYFCNGCYSKESSVLPTPATNTTIICYCHGCLEKLHGKLSDKERAEHYPKRMKTIKKLNLFAVLCIEKYHYVAFVKCQKSEQRHEWIFFDSMSDRLHNEKNVPRVSRVPDFDRWIDNAEQDKYFFEKLDRRRSEGKPTAQEFTEDEMRLIRLFQDGAFLFYENSVINYQ